MNHEMYENISIEEITDTLKIIQINFLFHKLSFIRQLVTKPISEIFKNLKKIPTSLTEGIKFLRLKRKRQI